MNWTQLDLTTLTASESARLKANDDDNALWKRECVRILEERRIRGLFASQRTPSQRHQAEILKRRLIRNLRQA